jgi:hypothetical protein
MVFRLSRADPGVARRTPGQVTIAIPTRGESPGGSVRDCGRFAVPGTRPGHAAARPSSPPEDRVWFRCCREPRAAIRWPCPRPANRMQVVQPATDIVTAGRSRKKGKKEKLVIDERLAGGGCGKRPSDRALQDRQHAHHAAQSTHFSSAAPWSRPPPAMGGSAWSNLTVLREEKPWSFAKSVLRKIVEQRTLNFF